MDKIKVLLDAIGEAEGSRPGYWEGNPYDLTLGRGKYTKPFGPISKMNLSEVKSLQNYMIKQGAMSSAVGKYQFIRKTLNHVQKKLGFSGDVVFNATTQDKMALYLLERRGLSKFQKGTISKRDFMENLSKEWASLPNPDTGKSYYGQRCHFTVKQMKEILSAIL